MALCPVTDRFVHAYARSGVREYAPRNMSAVSSALNMHVDGRLRPHNQQVDPLARVHMQEPDCGAGCICMLNQSANLLERAHDP